MSRGDVGPYIEEAGPRVWIPRTVPYLEARKIAQDANQNGDRLRYLGKVDADLLGFARDCRCDEVCEWREREDVETGDRPNANDFTCRVPAWSFELVER